MPNLQKAKLARQASSTRPAVQMTKRSVNAFTIALDRSVMHMDFDQHTSAAATEDASIAVAALSNGCASATAP